MKMLVKKCFSGNGANGKRVGWYANPNNPMAEGVVCGEFYSRHDKQNKHLYGKVAVKRVFGLNFDLVFLEKEPK